MIIILLLGQLIELQKCDQVINHENRIVDNPHTAILYGNSSLGYYYMNIYVGENMSKHSVIVDTGSQTTTINCDQCTQCGTHQNAPYKFNEKNYNSHELRRDFNCSSFYNNRCNYASYYVEGSSIGGFYLKDKVLIGDGLIQLDDKYIEQESFESIIGCTQFENGQLHSQLADGIFGLAPITNQSMYPPNLIDFIAKSDKAKSIKRSFSLCLNDNYGYISVGGYDLYRQDPDFQIKTIKFKPSQQYQINLTKIAVGDQIFSINDSIYTQGQGAFIDSGATISYMDKEIYNQFFKSIQNHFLLNQISINIYMQQQICFKFTENTSTTDSYSYFPNIKFIFDDNVEIYWKPKDYLNLYNNQVCIGVESLSDRVILGQNWMRKKDILFDLEQQEISIVQANCTLDYFKLQVVSSSDEKDQTEQQNHQVLKNIRLPSVLRLNIQDEQQISEEIVSEETDDETLDDESQKKVDEINQDEHSWLEILFYIFIVIITLKGLVFLGLYIMKRLGGNLYTYEQQKSGKFQKITIEENDENDSTSHQVELVIKQSDQIA